MTNIFSIKEIRFSVLTRQNIILLLGIYNATFLILCTLHTDNLRIAFFIAFVVSFITLIFLIGTDIFNDIREEENKILFRERELLKKVRCEYQKMYAMQRKKDLLTKASSLSNDSSKSETHDFKSTLRNKADSPDSKSRQTILLSYLSRITKGLKG